VKKTICLILCLIMITAALSVMASAEADEISIWNGLDVDSEWGSDYDSASTFYIEDADDFIKFRNMVMDEYSFSGKTITLNTDIDLDNYNLRYGVGGFTTTTNTSSNSGNWYHSLSMFYGVFDGNGHVIKNITMNQNEDDAVLDTATYGDCKMVGLFYARAATIQNLGIENVTVTLANSGTARTDFAGGLCSVNYLSGITNCFVKNITFSGGSAITNRMRLGVISGYHRAATMKNCYVNGADFTGITVGKGQGALQVGGIAYAEEAGTKVENCYIANVVKDGPNFEKYNGAILNNNDKDATLTNVYSEEHYAGSSGSTALLDIEDVTLAETLGAGFRDMSARKQYPLLAWEELPPAFECESMKVYKNYGTSNEVELSDGVVSGGELTAVISGFKNNTGDALENAVVNFSCISGGKLVNTKSVFVTVGENSAADGDIEVTLDLTDVEFAEGDFLQIVTYKGADEVIPLLKVKRIEK